jgi:DNA polymerase III sliding clamp (beta) subunit (PCNA family)
LVTVEEPGEFNFPSVALEIANVIPDGDVSISVEEGFVEVVAGTAVWRFRVPDGSEYPAFPQVPEEFHEVPVEAFVKAIAGTLHAATADARPSLMMLDISGGRMRASDGVRYRQVEMEWWPEGFDTHIPVVAVPVLLRLLKAHGRETVEVGQTDEHLMFRLGADMFGATKLVDRFPDVEGLLLEPATANDQRFSVQKEEFQQALRRVKIAADPATSSVRIEFEGGRVFVRATDRFGSLAQEELTGVEWDGSDRSVVVSYRFLDDLLRVAGQPVCEFVLGKDGARKRSPVLYREPGVIEVLLQQRG